MRFRCRKTPKLLSIQCLSTGSPSKSHGVFRKVLSLNNQSTSISINKYDWIYYSDSSITINDWSIIGNILYVLGDSTTNKTANSIKEVIFVNTGNSTYINLVTIYGNNSYNITVNSSDVFSSIRWSGSSFSINTFSPYFFIGNYMLMSIGLV